LDSGGVFAVIRVALHQAFSQELRFMPCPLCGDICRCSSDAHSAASSRWVNADDALTAATMPLAEPEMPEAKRASSHPASGASNPTHSPESDPEMEPESDDSSDWRQEVASRLSRYHARRKPRPPRYPSLLLHFDREESIAPVSDTVGHMAFPPITTVSNQALALDTFADLDLTPEVSPARTSVASSTIPTVPTTATTAPTTAKIIEFPRSWTPPPAPLDELAEPVFDRNLPRILDVPDVIPPPPALGGITIEPAQQPETEKRPGIDTPLQSAPLARRVLSAGIDAIIIGAACALFGFIFWKVTTIRPPRLQILGLGTGLSALFWSVYQYLLVVHAGTTPGLRLARLQLTRFDGRPATRRLRRWRVLASFLSAASLGMGYAWVFLDEDSLCWHDRITHTYLAPKS
jgi:uncharacterized RDD family membrane protein YckC